MSPWERALGEQLEGLDPGLRSYFGTIPLGSAGRGEGVFEVVGTPRRWLWPVLAALAIDGIVFPVWEHSVPFTVTNRPTTRGTVQARRVFHFEGGDATMTDEIGITAAGLTDRLGQHGLVSSTLAASVVNGRLVLRSTGVTLRLGRVRVPLGALSPRVTLVERTEGERQHVSLRLSLPAIGTVYEYAGSFSYRVVEESGV
ncbi:MAG: hypothetical protein JWR04_3057 [Rhodoglobus sp.]|nr:hypothetical protein [Rhodoglobus sp.]